MKIKICGLRDKENIEQIASVHFDYMGFIFYPKSKRFVGEDFVMPNVGDTIKKVGVFVNAEPYYILENVKKYNLNAIQLHGDESPEYIEELKKTLPDDVSIIKAFGVNEDFDFTQLKPYESICNYFLFDTKTKDYGGSGHQFNWDVLNNYNNVLPYFLSGGIGIHDIDTIKNSTLKPFAIDVNSKFELEPGLKDIELIKRLKQLI
jgi:phosphoribosylanthranilate isomerase